VTKKSETIEVIRELVARSAESDPDVQLRLLAGDAVVRPFVVVAPRVRGRSMHSEASED